jgi:GTP-binding protein
MFIDFTKVELHAGNGGKGCVSFRREKYVSKAAQMEGMGVVGEILLLLPIRTSIRCKMFDMRVLQCKSGTQGSSGLKTGKNGDDIYIRVPVGTLIRNIKSDEVVADLIKPKHEVVICAGGKGGRGNVNFKSSTRQAPRYAQSGLDGESGHYEFELKILADVGLVGYPNAGKSTLLSVLSKAKPKIADYPFTTLEPHLGIVKSGEYKSFLMADIPGLIEGASKGKGLGHQFLRHIERNRLLLFLIDGTDPEPESAFNALKKELTSFNKSLMLKPIMLIRTKGDTLGKIEQSKWDAIPEFLMEISAVTRNGLDKLVREISHQLDEA